MTVCPECRARLERALREEIRLCRIYGALHVGGSGRPDCVFYRAPVCVEVKAWRSKVDSGTVARTMEKDWDGCDALVFHSLSGLTGPAIDLIQRSGGVALLVPKEGDVGVVGSSRDLVGAAVHAVAAAFPGTRRYPTLR